jgi:hypothetical protein
MIAAWRRYWFTPASLTDLGVSRAVLAAILLWLNGTTRFRHVATVAPSLWVPVPLLTWLDIPQPDATTLHWMAVATAVACVAVMLGVGTRAAVVALLALELVQEAYINSFGKVTHATVPVLYALAFFTLAPCDRGFALDGVLRRARRAFAGPAVSLPPDRTSSFARWPIDLLYVELGAYYFLAGLSKLRDSGIAWGDGYTLQYHLLDFGTPLGQRVAQDIGLCAALSGATLLFELLFWTGVVRRLRPFWLVAGALFHLGTTVMLDISFWPVVATYLLFVPWSRVVRLRVRSRDVPYDGTCARCRALASIACDVDLPGALRFRGVSGRHLHR